MKSELNSLPSTPTNIDTDPAEEQREARFEYWVELFASVILALATIATAWSAYQSSLWNGEQAAHNLQVSIAEVRVAKFSTLAEQKISLHASLFGQWASAVSGGDQRLAEFAFARFPEPLRTAANAWQATRPLTNPTAPATPFNMPEYVLAEQAEVERWEAIAVAESAAAERANAIAERYLLFTIIFASVLFFGGISGKFRRPAMDVAALVLGTLAFLLGAVILATLPIA